MKKILEDDFEFRTKTIYLSKQKATQIKQNLEPNFIYNSTPKFSRANISYPKNFTERVNKNRGSSANIRKAKSNSQKHNERNEEKEPKYFLPLEYRQENETWDCGISEQELFEQELQKYNEIKKGYNGKRPAFENCKWEMIINLNNTHDMADCQKVANYVANKFNFHSTRIAIHRDEGRLIDLDNADDKTNTLILTGKRKNCYKDENSKKYYWDKELSKEINVGVVYNYHAHLNFLTIKDAKQNMRRAYIKREDLSELQTKLAIMLDMPRGEIIKESERSSDKKHRSGREYAKEQHEQQETLLNLKEQKEILEIERKASVGNNYTKDYFRELKRLATKELKSKDELEKEIKELKIKHDKFYSSKDYTKALENKIIELNNDKNDLLGIIKQTSDNFIELAEQAKQDSIERLEKAKLMEEELKKEKEMLYDMYSTADKIMRDEIAKDRFMTDKVNDRFASLSESTFRDTLYKYAILHPITSEYEKKKLEEQKQKERIEKEKVEAQREAGREQRRAERLQTQNDNFGLEFLEFEKLLGSYKTQNKPESTAVQEQKPKKHQEKERER
ncbi:hypothetical protein [Campylobacter magnus]|uniref:hypothetical protein n=1 Tax=Campylobacter magnus TaxID=3026462 RepID=UPI0023610BD1|nr:hypothetical protein [Campylobacter magnus]MDD0856144.1 hypothetical protein [Campylobacter magnus]